jgi:hypothetical protein
MNDTTTAVEDSLSRRSKIPSSKSAACTNGSVIFTCSRTSTSRSRKRSASSSAGPRVGQVHPDPLHQPAGRAPARPDRGGRHRTDQQHQEYREDPDAKSAWSSSTSTSFPTSPSWKTWPWAPSGCARYPRKRPKKPPCTTWKRCRSPSRPEISRPAFRRAAAARGHRPQPVHGPQGHAVRRADLGPGPGDDQRGAGRHDRPGPGGHDHAGGHPRDGFRQECGPPRAVHGLRPDRGGKHTR